MAAEAAEMDEGAPGPASDAHTAACPGETDLLAFADGELPEGAREQVARHLETCGACVRLVGRIAGRAEGGAPPGTTEAPEPLERGASIGRYVILAEAGRGGMSEVYAAYDPKLDRRVALKILGTTALTPDERARVRLLREAKAIAKLSHPNVVTVHDAGTVGDRIFIAMEFVDGETLTEWLAGEPRARAEILRVFASAARGLAAAHAAGLVHRDFKPHNVMVGKDGIVRVMDFGLVRDLAATTEDAAPTSGERPQDELADGGLTRTGELLGTPRYMAPEQFKAEPVDARTDQFSFFVALHEALYGQRPFAGKTLSELMTNVVAGQVVPAPPKAAVPGWLRRVLLRGLSVAREDRFPSMDAALEALMIDPTARRRRVSGALLAGLAIAAVAIAAHRTGSAKQALCQGGAQRWSGVWEADGLGSSRKEAIRRAFVATGKSYAEQAAASVARMLDDYVARWLGTYRQACEATHLSGEQSAEVLDLRMACLAERRSRVQALTDVFVKADGTVVENAVAATSALPRLERCSDARALRAVVPPPEDEPTRARVDALRTELAHLIAERDAGHCAEGERLEESLIPRVRAVKYLPLLAETLTTGGGLMNTCGDLERGLGRLREGYLAGLASGDDEAAAIAAIFSTSGIGYQKGQPGPAREWLAVAQALLDRMGGNPLLQTWLLVGEGNILCTEGRAGEAVAVFEASRAAKVRLLGDHNADVLQSSLSIGNALHLAGRDEESWKVSAALADESARVLGPGHPAVAMILDNEGEALLALGRFGEAHAAFERALDIMRRAGSDPSAIAMILTDLGLSLIGGGRAEQAIEPLEAALRTRREKHEPPDHLAETGFALARALWSRPDERRRARSLAEAARAEYEQANNAATEIAKIDAWLRAPS
jgi:hypothetical protein